MDIIFFMHIEKNGPCSTEEKDYCYIILRKEELSAVNKMTKD
jgi:hypothetical protein